MGKPITITLSLPTLILSQNSNAHWRKRSAAVKVSREAANAQARSALGIASAPQWPSGRIVLRFFWDWRGEGRQRYPDKWNAIAACKSMVDGITDAGIYANDRDVVPELGGWTIDQENPRLVVECYGPANGKDNA